jgi:hypothetical protein
MPDFLRLWDGKRGADAQVKGIGIRGALDPHSASCYATARILLGQFVFLVIATAAMGQQPTLESCSTIEGMRGQQIVLTGANLPPKPESVRVRLGTLILPVVEAGASSLKFRIPSDAPLGQQPLSVIVAVGENKEEITITPTLTGGKKFFTVISEEVGPLKVESVAPLVSYPSQENYFDFKIVGQGFSRRGNDNQLEIEKQGVLRIRWDETENNTADLDRKKYDGRGFVVSDRQLEIHDVGKGTYRPPLKLRVRVGDQVTDAVLVTFAVVGEKTPLLASIGVLIALLVIVVLVTKSGLGSRQNPDGPQVSLIARFVLDPETDTYSLSKLQFYLWTFAAVFGYCFLTISRSLIQGQFELADIPEGLPGIIGASAGTTILATGITNAKGPKGAGPVHPSLSDLITTGGVVAPERFQFLIWTLLGVGSFAFLIALHDPANLKDLPKIPSGFLYLMGISSAGYLGGKFARKPGPVVDTVVAQEGSLKLELRGRNLATDAMFRIATTDITYELVSNEKRDSTVASEVDKKAKLQVITKEDAPNSEAFAKALLLTIAKPEDAWLSTEQEITITNPDGQKAVATFTAARKAADVAEQIGQVSEALQTAIANAST